MLTSSVSLPDSALRDRVVKPLIHPQHFQWGWDLPAVEAAEILTVEIQTFRKYNVRYTSTARREPSKSVQRLAAIITELWLLQGKQPKDSRFLLDS